MLGVQSKQSAFAAAALTPDRVLCMPVREYDAEEAGVIP